MLFIGITLGMLGCDDQTVPPSAQTRPVLQNQQSTEQENASRWSAVDRLNRRTCPSTQCGVVGQVFFRESVQIFEIQNGWARITHYYDASCVLGVSEYIDFGNPRCEADNGIVEEQFAEWVSVEHLSETRPPDPGANRVGIADAVSQSDDFRRYERQFVDAAAQLINDGRCTERDFRNNGGWIKSVTTHRDQPVYFTYCGSFDRSGRLYLDVSSGRIFR